MLTYKQIEQIEKFIKEIDYLRNNSFNEEELYEGAVALDKRIAASGVGYHKATVSWEHCAIYTFTSEMKYYRSEIEVNLNVMTSALNGLLNAVSKYPYILEIKKNIQRGSKLSKTEAKRAFIIEMSAKYQGKIDFGKAIQEYVKKDELSFWTSDENAYHRGVVERLRMYLTELCEDKKETKPSSKSEKTVVHVNQNQSVSQQVNVTITFEDCFKALDDCETLGEEELKEIKAQIQEIQELLKDKKGKKKTIREKISSVLKWVANKGTDVMIAVLPFVLQNLQGL